MHKYLGSCCRKLEHAQLVMMVGCNMKRASEHVTEARDQMISYQWVTVQIKALLCTVLKMILHIAGGLLVQLVGTVSCGWYQGSTPQG